LMCAMASPRGDAIAHINIRLMAADFTMDIPSPLPPSVPPLPA
jgi:hypothetical protein